MGDEYLGIDDTMDTQQVSDMNISGTTGQNLEAASSCAPTEVRAAESKKKSIHEAGGGSSINPNVSEKRLRINTAEGQKPNDNFFQVHGTKIGLIVLIVICIGVAIALGVGLTSGQQQAGMTYL